MNDLVKNSVESRKTAISSAGEIKNEEIKKKLEDFFRRLEEYASKYDDVMKFESDFASSDLNKEYMNLFTEIMTDGQKKENVVTDSLKYEMTEGLASTVRGRAHRAAYDKARDIPVVGDILSANRTIGFFSRFRKNKKDE